MHSLFFELIRVALGTQDNLSRVPSQKEWEVLYAIAMKQSLVGVCFAGLQTLGADADEGFARIGMSEMLYLDWMGMAAQIQQKNELMNDYIEEVKLFFRDKGIPCAILKGQAIAELYQTSDNLKLLRQSGDVDVWVKMKRLELYQMSLSLFGTIEGANYHHVKFPLYDDVEVEVHIHPSYLSSPIRNFRFKKFCALYEPTSLEDNNLSIAFNRVYILLHCYRHFCGHGIGLRQIMDYYFVLNQGCSSLEKEDTLICCKHLGMLRFLGAMMWIMKEVFFLQDDKLLCTPNEEEGQFLLEEVLMTGNFGRIDNRYHWEKNGTSMKRFIMNQKRNMHLLSHYPHEVCWDPLFSISMYMLKKFKGI